MASDPAKTKMYYEPGRTMLNAINDLVEIQKADVVYSAISLGKIYFRVEMYGFLWEYQFTVEDIDINRSRVTLEISGEAMNKTEKIYSQFALLDSMLGNSKYRIGNFSEK